MNRITTCPNCSKRLRVSEQITDKTLICPHCFAAVDNSWPGNHIRTADINTDVKRGLNAGSFVLPVLLVLCVIGLFPFIPMIFVVPYFLLVIAIERIIRWRNSGVRISDINPDDVKRGWSVGSIVLAVLLIGFCVLGLILFLFLLNSSPPKEETAKIRFLLLMTATLGVLDVLLTIAIVRVFHWRISGVRIPLASRIIGFTFMVLGSIAAVVIFFYFTCFGLVAVDKL